MAPQREWFEQDYYKILGVPKSATAKEVTSAYRKLAKQHHPDTNAGNDEKFKEISAAYDVLGDAAKRKEYDEVRELGPMAGGFGGGGGPAGSAAPAGPTSGWRTWAISATSSAACSAGAAGGAAGARCRGGPPAGAPTWRRTSTCRSTTPWTGVTTKVHIATEARCHTCSGSGSAPGTTPGDLPALRGDAAPCRTTRASSPSARSARAAAAGEPSWWRPCPTCHGTGTEQRGREVKVRIPPGVEDGQRIRVKGRGAGGRNGGPAGDLYVVVRVDRHGLFGRRGRNLTLTVPVTFAEAALGSTSPCPRSRPGHPAGPGRDAAGRDVPGEGPRRARRAARPPSRRPAGHRRRGGARAS